MAREKKPVHRVQNDRRETQHHSPTPGGIQYPVSRRHSGCFERSSGGTMTKK